MTGSSPVSPAEVDIAGSVEELEAMAPEWSDLADRCQARACSYPWWGIPFLRHAARGVPRVVTLRQEGRLVGLVPCYETPAGPVRVVRMLGHGFGAVGRPLIDPGAAGGPAAAARAAGAALLGPRRFLHLSGIELVPGWAELVQPAGRVTLSPDTVCPVVDTTGPFDAWWADRPRTIRRSVRRGQQWLSDHDTTWRPEVVRDRERLGAVLPAVTGVFDAAEARLPRAHLLAGPAGAFTRAMLEAAADAGRLFLVLGWAGPDLASFDVALKGGRRLSAWAGRIHPGWRPSSPGHLSLHEMVRAMCADPDVDEVDLMMGGEDYKQRWADSVYTTALLEAAGRPAWFEAGRLAMALARHRPG